MKEMDNLKVTLKNNITMLIDNGKLEEAVLLIQQYKEIVSDDVEVYSMEAIIYMMKGNFDKSENILLDGLIIDEENFDLNYNLAYVYNEKEDYNLAYKYYKKASERCNNQFVKEEISIVLDNIRIKKPSLLKEKKKIVFFDKGDDKFIWDIVNELCKEYEVKKVTITNLSQIDEWMEWADICWFEWCDELVAYGSKHKLAKEKKIICRLHRYEALTSYPQNVEWENVDKLVIVTDHLKNFLLAQLPDIDKRVEIITIRNGVNLDKYELKERNSGFNIAYIGYIHQRKNPFLLIQIIEKLVKIDKRYKLYVAGQFQDSLIELYWNYQVEKMGLQNNVIFQGWQNNINKWLEDKNYIVSTSIHESFGYGIAEAMARGIKPVIHDFVFSEEIWDEKYLFNTIDEAVNMILDKKYDSKEYRKFIEEKYSLNKQIEMIKGTIEEINKKENNNIIILEYIYDRLNKFIGYSQYNFDNYDFESSKIIIGKKENINDDYELIEFIIMNSSNKKLVISNIWSDRKNNQIIIPDQMKRSKNIKFIVKFIHEAMQCQVDFINGIAGFVFNKDMIEDIKINADVYNWERAIPASQFMTMLGYLKIAERYIFAGDFINNSDTVLEAPCEFGYGAAYFSSLCSHVEALDIADDNINFAKETYSMNNISWVKGDVTNLEYKDDEFDVYVSYEVFEHLSLDMVEKYLHEAYRVIKRGGKFIISTPNREMRKHINNPFHIKEYSFVEFSRLIEKYFNRIEYYSVSNYKVEKGMKDTAVNMIAVCMK
ncbi:methyltransferase domain-containing protein [Clostridium sp. BSD9I1]|uniref:methyltransferase domain-containing protein n=1 Tax=Clostridium sp. BSD9I1 TaxID=2003589 RepID=UPI001FA909EA|nr:methyltransferase domain-containing protein [Clostridium sp. BSD9I1]